MLKKTIVYEDFNGETVSEDHHFHLSKADLVELEMSKKGGMQKWIENIIASNDGAEIISEFKKLLKLSYGVKSPDGKRFQKDDTLWRDFVETEAYSTLFMELVTDAEAAAAFVNGIMPAGLNLEVEKIAQATQTPKVMESAALAAIEEVEQKMDPAAPNFPPHPRVLTRAEATAMDVDELKHLIAEGATILPLA